MRVAAGSPARHLNTRTPPPSVPPTYRWRYTPGDDTAASLRAVYHRAPQAVRQLHRKAPLPALEPVERGVVERVDSACMHATGAINHDLVQFTQGAY